MFIIFKRELIVLFLWNEDLKKKILKIIEWNPYFLYKVWNVSYGDREEKTTTKKIKQQNFILRRTIRNNIRDVKINIIKFYKYFLRTWKWKEVWEEIYESWKKSKITWTKNKSKRMGIGG